MDIRKKYETDEQAEINGVWRDLGDGAKVLIARAGNQAFKDLTAKLYEQNKETLDADTPEARALNKKLMSAVLARTILLGWQGITEDGQTVPYSHDKAEEYLNFTDFSAEIQRLSQDRERYLKQRQEGEAKNSESA